jgi:hypothetical protein
MSGMPRRVIGVLLIIAAPVAVAIGYASAPAASTCARTNDFNQALGEEPTCSTTPSAVYFWAGQSEPRCAFGTLASREPRLAG